MQSHRATVVPLRATAAVALAAVAAGTLLAAGCATAPPRPKIAYPPPPDPPRVLFIRSFQRPDDLQTGGFQGILNAIIPHDSGLATVNPAGLALSPDEKVLYVASPPRSQVLAIDLASGDFKAIGTTGQRRLGRPIGVGTDADGLLYVSDKQANAVLVYEPDGRLKRVFGADRLVQPTGLAVDRKGQQVYVINDATTQTGRHTVEVFALDGRHLRTMGGGRSPAPGVFNFPSDLAVNAAGHLYVADMLNFRVQVFDMQGGLLKMFGQPGSGYPGLFDKIHGISFDTFGNVYVVDLMQGIQILNDLNQPLMSFGEGIVGAPLGIVVDSRNHIFVSDYQHAVHEFELVNTTAEDSRRATPPSSGQTPQDPAKP
jgi:DNA-binding beta-propeller fold protein YncE